MLIFSVEHLIMQLSLQTFTSLIQNMAAAVQVSSNPVAGSYGRFYVARSSGGQRICGTLDAMVDLTGSADHEGRNQCGPDLDSWMADMSLSRLPAVPAVGSVTFSRYTASAPSLVPAGVLVRTGDGTVTFIVTVDTTNLDVECSTQWIYDRSWSECSHCADRSTGIGYCQQRLGEHDFVDGDRDAGCRPGHESDSDPERFGC